MISLGLAAAAVSIGGLLGFLVVCRRASSVVEPSRRDDWFHALVTRTEVRNSAGRDQSK